MSPPSCAQGARLQEMSVDRLAGVDPTHLVHRVIHRQLHCPRQLTTEPFLQHGRRQREAGRTPASIAPRCSKAGDLALDDRNLKRGPALEQIVGRPESGVAGSQDCYLLNAAVLTSFTR